MSEARWFRMDTVKPTEKDGDVVLYSMHMRIYWIGRLRYGGIGEPQQDEFAWRCASSGRFANPTHWTYLPAAPKDGVGTP